MKLIKLYIGMIVGVLAMLTSCTEGYVDATPSNGEEQGMTINFNIAIPSYIEKTTRSVTFGTNEGINGKEDMLLFCFDNNGQFVGFAKIENFENIPKHEVKNDGSSDEKKIKAIIPTATSRIHFVANANKQYQSINVNNQAQWVGMHENTLMTTFETEYGEDQAQQTRYWGYVQKDNPTELKQYLTSKSKDHIVHLVRDRAKITASWADPNKTDEISISVINGEAYGTLAPFNRTMLKFPTTTGDDTWRWDIDYITPSVSTRRLKGDVGQMKNPTYTFENRNLPNDPMKVILKINEKYYFIYLQDEKNVPYIIKRNYEYKIVITKLDESLGWINSEEALKGAPANNPWIKVEETIPEISDDTYSLSIEGGTYQMLNAGSGEQTVKFTYSGDHLSQEDFYVSWIKNEQYATAAEPKVTLLSYDESKKKLTGVITYELNTIDDNLREGTIHLIDTRHGLNKNIHLYSIREFNYEWEQPESLSKNVNSTATLKFTIPNDFPTAFLPLQVKVASDDVTIQNGSVEVSDTKAETGEDWNCWSVYQTANTNKQNGQANVPKTYAITLKNLRKDAKAGDIGCFYLKTNFFNQGMAKKFEFTYQ